MKLPNDARESGVSPGFDLGRGRGRGRGGVNAGILKLPFSVIP